MAVITISRGTFSGGQTLAERLAERLGYECLSREDMIEEATRTYGVSADELTAAMDKPPSLWERLSGERRVYLNFMRAVLGERVRRGNLVFHGYSGHLLLPRVPGIICVREIEDLDSRVENAMRRHNLQRKEAIARIKKLDRERSEWTHFLWGVDWQDPLLYDAVLNITRMGIPGACEVVVRMADLDVFRTTPESLQTIEDIALASRVWAALAMDEFIAGRDLEVTASRGIVSISGAVGLSEVADAIPALVGGIEGVQGVRSDVSVQPPVYDVSF